MSFQLNEPWICVDKGNLEQAQRQPHACETGNEDAPPRIAASTASTVKQRRVESDSEKLKHLQRNFSRKAKALREIRTELGESRQEAEDIQRRLEESDRDLQRARRELDQYKSWWMNEYCFVRVLLQMLPDAAEVEAIAASSHGRFAKYCEQ